MELLSGTFGVILGLFPIVLALLWFILPFAVFRMRREAIETTRLVSEIRDHLVMGKTPRRPDNVTDPSKMQHDPYSDVPKTTTTWIIITVVIFLAIGLIAYRATQGSQ